MHCYTTYQLKTFDFFFFFFFFFLLKTRIVGTCLNTHNQSFGKNIIKYIPTYTGIYLLQYDVITFHKHVILVVINVIE